MIEDIIRKVFGLPPGNKKINQDLALMRQIMKPYQSGLIPFREESELELMSLKLDLKSQKKGLDKIECGTIQSIYAEPMVCFAYKDYIKGEREALLCCRTSDAEFIFRIKKQNVDVYFNGTQVALMDRNNILHGLKSRGILGRIKPYSNDLLSIIVKDREVGQMFNPLRPHAHQQRAFTLLSHLNDEEEAIFISLTLYELLTLMLEKKGKK